MQSNRARYLIRFDDLCPTMNFDIWNSIESILVKYNIKPIVAVIPHNEDRKFYIKPHDADFWAKVKTWEQMGWTIAVHGYNHVYTNHSSGLLGIAHNSEYSCVDKDIQEAKIKNGLATFNSKQLEATMWIAPSHSFDLHTIKLLRKYGYLYISDGKGNKPFTYYGMKWIPCQIWDRIVDRPKGVWTVCMHFNKWSSENLLNFHNDIEKYHEQIISLDDINQNQYSTNTAAKIIENLYYAGLCKTKYVVKKLIFAR